MKKIQKHTAGFGTVELVLVLIIAALLAGLGWYVWNQNKDKKTVSNDTSQNTAITTEKKTATSVYDGWKEYCSLEEKSCFKYPSDWTYSVITGDSPATQFKSPAGSIVSWSPAISGIGGGCDPETEPHVFINSATPVPAVTGLYVVEYGKSSSTSEDIAIVDSDTPIKTGDTGDCIYFGLFDAKHATVEGAGAAAQLHARYEQVKDADKATVKNILLSYRY